ncbi:MAG: PKD domain-containing protein, partial [Pseudomonadota bacterium]
MTKKLSILFLLFALTSTAVFAQNCQALFSTQPTTFATTWQFTDMSTSNPGNPPVSNWFWDFGDGNTSNQQNPTHTYNTPGAFLVCLTITAGNCTSVYCDTAGYAVGPNCSVTGTGSVSGNTVSFGTTTQSSG